MENKMDERFFKELAKAYAENEGAALADELAEIEKENRLPQALGLAKKIKSKKFNHKFRSYSLKLLPMAASFIIVFLLVNNYRDGLKSSPGTNMPAPTSPIVAESPENQPVYSSPGPVEDALQSSVELVSASLPAGYALAGVDYDNAAAIMEITNEKSNRIVLVAEAYYDFDKEGFSAITVNDSPAYTLVKNDYCLLKYTKDDMLYTLTSMYDYGDLLEIIENI